MDRINFRNNEVKLIKRKRSKYMRLTVTPIGEIKLTVPEFVKVNEINRFLEMHSEWLKQVLQKITPPIKLNFKTNDEIKLIGEDFKLKLYPAVSDKPKCYLDRTTRIIHIFQPKSEHDLKEKDLEQIKLLLKRELIEFAREKITLRAEEICAKVKTSFNKISIREQRSRWGSCSSKGNLNFNWKIILAPESVYNYVISHEVAHLIEHNHSAAFWQIVYDLHPTYKLDRRWLKENAASLEII